LETRITDSEDQEEDGWKEEPNLYTQQVPYVPSVENSCYNDLKYYIQHGMNLNISMPNKREFEVEIHIVSIGSWYLVQKKL
jgi:hypothetical protein